jgi:serine O-acetyltransferase
MQGSRSRNVLALRRARRNGGKLTGIPAKRLADGISAEVPDWRREARPSFWAPSQALLASIRSYQRHAGRNGAVALLARGTAILRHRFWSVVTGADIPLNCQIAGGLKMPHPNGIVIHPAAVIGPNCLIMQQVTIGGGRNGAPAIGGHVDFGAGAKVLGGVTIGDHANIGANALVIHDVPAGAVVFAPLGQIRAPGS